MFEILSNNSNSRPHLFLDTRPDKTRMTRAHSSSSSSSASSSRSLPPIQIPPRARPLDAMGYIDEIKFTYADEPQTYHHFLAAMQDFKSGRSNVTETIRRVAVLFRYNKQLYEGFNAFLPPGYGIVPADPRSTGGLDEVVITTPEGVERRVFR
ncbi:hypothetical protein PM082_014329 [Marasmius tenuissimus]|nr:hypothetical protein PM082_014329 [Marasmius tenuissimus]